MPLQVDIASFGMLTASVSHHAQRVNEMQTSPQALTMVSIRDPALSSCGAPNWKLLLSSMKTGF